MNRRIKELAEQADKLVSEKNKYYGLMEYSEKFAELIVRECMDLLEDYTTDVHVGGIAYNVLSAEETLQKHFGVEE